MFLRLLSNLEKNSQAQDTVRIGIYSSLIGESGGPGFDQFEQSLLIEASTLLNI